jgi:two-component system, chemotaxis family, chemotaxis protein CheY
MQFSGKVLIVDDEPHIRRFLGLVLQRFGQPTIVEAGNGEEALALYRQHHPDLVLMDVNMPVLDGMQALERLLQEDPDAIVVMLTSLATRSIVERCVELGAANFVRKDTPKETIAQVLADTIARAFPTD